MTVSKSQRFIQIGHIWPTPNLFNKVSISTSAAAVYQIRTSLLLNVKTKLCTLNHIFISHILYLIYQKVNVHTLVLYCLSEAIFEWFGKDPIVPIKGNVNATAYNDIHIIACFQICGNRLGKALFQRDNAPVQNARSVKKWFSDFGLEDLDGFAPLGIEKLTANEALSLYISPH